MKTLKHIAKIREYCDYLEEHILNVEKAWKIVQEKCADLHPICDDYHWSTIDADIRFHDLSKVSLQEFIQYQRKFFPVKEASYEDNINFAAAWENHKARNPHHWENWTKKEESFPNETACDCVSMVCDWMAMSMKLGGTAAEFYAKNKHKMNLPPWADKLVLDMFSRIYPKDEAGKRRIIAQIAMKAAKL